MRAILPVELCFEQIGQNENIIYRIIRAIKTYRATAMHKILIVEDHADIRRLIRMTLEFEPVEIHEAADADAGQVAAQALRPDLVLLDVMMPGTLDGLALCRALRADPALAKVQVVMLSARGTTADRQAGLDAGANAYLVKPFSPMQLLELSGSLLGALL
jgi:DNA-binding response OmpR family regulator